MAKIDQSGLSGKIRDRPISPELEKVLLKAAEAAGVDEIYVTSGGQPGSTGQSIGSTRHNGGRAADLQLIVDGRTQTFSDEDGGDVVERFVTAAAANGATGIGAGIRYMGPATLHVGFGRTPEDRTRLVWGANGASANAPSWLRDAAAAGWNSPPAWAFQSADRSRSEFAGPGHPNLTQLDVPDRFNEAVIMAARTTQGTFDIPASVTLAQWAVESAYGKRMPANSNNPFGIKARAGETAVAAMTKEFIGGQMRTVEQRFRVFASLDEAFLQHGRLLATGAAYAPARRFKNDPDRFADALTGVYATDPNYGSILKSIMKRNNLYRFDVVSEIVLTGSEADVTRPVQREDQGSRVEELQRRLVKLGYNLGKIDGKFGSLTAGALLAFQSDNDLATTGVLDDATQAALDAAESRPLDRGRTSATEQDLANDNSRIVLDARKSRLLSWILSGFGMFGIGNSAIVTAAGTSSASGTRLPDGLLPFLGEVHKLGAGPPPAGEIARLSEAAGRLSAQLGVQSLPPDVVKLVTQLRQLLTPETLARNPNIAKMLDTLDKGVIPQKSGAPATIFDFLAGNSLDGGLLQNVLSGLATVAGSTVPGFGGSLAVLGAGLASRYFANRIAAQRVEDQRTAGNINPLGFR